MQQLLDKWERLRRSEYLRPDEKLMLNHCISDLKRLMNHSGEVTEMVGKRTAVDWLHLKLSTSSSEEMVGNINLWFEQAKEMEREQMIEFGAKCLQSQNETYGGNK
jgi:hypothetical protein